MVLGENSVRKTDGEITERLRREMKGDGCLYGLAGEGPGESMEREGEKKLPPGNPGGRRERGGV